VTTETPMNAAEVCHRCEGRKTEERVAGPGTVRPAVVVCPRCKGTGEEPAHRKRGGGRWPEPPPDEVVRPILTEAARVGALLKSMSHNTRSEEYAERRAELYRDVRRLAHKASALHIRQGVFADALGMSRYGLNLILSGKKRER